MKPARTLLAVLAGYLVMLVCEIVGAVFLAVALHGRGHAATLFGNELVVLLAGLIAGAVAARIGRVRPVLHAALLATVVFVITVAVAALSPRTGGAPSWYALSLACIGAFGAVVGGALTSGTRSA